MKFLVFHYNIFENKLKKIKEQIYMNNLEITNTELVEVRNQ